MRWEIGDTIVCAKLGLTILPSAHQRTVLGNLGTLPAHRGKGAGTALTRWPFEKADQEGLPVYLDTDERGPAKRIYDRLGFEKVDEVSTERLMHLLMAAGRKRQFHYVTIT